MVTVLALCYGAPLILLLLLKQYLKKLYSKIKSHYFKLQFNTFYPVIFM